MEKTKIEYCQSTWSPVTGCYHDCPYCLSGETLILMLDGTSKKLSEIKTGDLIYGVDCSGGYKKLKPASVIAKWETQKEAYEITLGNGAKIVCSGDHRWLTKRGWKYTTGTMNGPNRRPYLTTSNSMLGFDVNSLCSTMAETDEYAKGYLSGMIRGDGLIGSYDYTGLNKNRKNRSVDTQYQFRLALTDIQGLERTKAFLERFGIVTHDFIFKQADNNHAEMRGIRTHKKADIESIKSLVAFCDDPEFYRGFLAGIYDAEGSAGKIKRISNGDEEILRFTEKALSYYHFRYVRETSSNGRVPNIRIDGGVNEHIRFRQLTNNAIIRKFDLTGLRLKSELDLSVVEIRKTGETVSMYDISTTTENFIANGVVSHNCYARGTANRFKGCDIAPDGHTDERIINLSERLKVTNNDGVTRNAAYPYGFTPTLHEYRLNDPLTKGFGKTIFVCSMADLFGDWVPDEWIEKVFDACKEAPNHRYLFLTKNPMRYIKLADAGKLPKMDNFWYGSTVTQPGMDAFWSDGHNTFLSIEPIQKPFPAGGGFGYKPDWVILGAETGNHKDKVIPERSWIESVVDYCNANGIAVFMKDSMKPMWGEELLTEFPWAD